MAAKKGNKYAVGCNNGGDPPPFNSVIELQSKIDEYFETMPDKRKNG